MFAILFEALLIEILEEIPRFAGWEGGLMGTKIVNKHFVNKPAFPKCLRRRLQIRPGIGSSCQFTTRVSDYLYVC